MPRTKTSFKNYAEASRFMRKLNLHTMQDWIDFSKGQGPDGKTRPKDIPSNPWTVYGPQLEAEGKKFSINAFLGSKTATKKVEAKKVATTRKVAAKKVAAPVTTARTATRRVAKSATTEVEKSLTYSTLRSILRKMHVKNQADFNALVRMKLLPKQCPKNPPLAFKSQWKSWKTFLA